MGLVDAEELLSGQVSCEQGIRRPRTSRRAYGWCGARAGGARSRRRALCWLQLGDRREQLLLLLLVVGGQGLL